MSIDWSTLKTAETLVQEKLEEQAKQVRKKRNDLIRKTDFYMLPDSPGAPEGLTEYRQALRDITKQQGFPYDVEWPVMENI